MMCYKGNFHALVLYGDDAELALAKEAVSRINRKAIELEGTCRCYFLDWMLVFITSYCRYRGTRRWYGKTRLSRN
jgi:hypothetical protein